MSSHPHVSSPRRFSKGVYAPSIFFLGVAHVPICPYVRGRAKSGAQILNCSTSHTEDIYEIANNSTAELAAHWNLVSAFVPWNLLLAFSLGAFPTIVCCRSRANIHPVAYNVSDRHFTIRSFKFQATRIFNCIDTRIIER